MHRMLAILLLALVTLGVAIAQTSVQDEPMQPTQPIPTDARVLTDNKEVQEQTPDGIYTWKCYTHMYAWTGAMDCYVARACSTSHWFGETPVTAYYVEVFGPYRVVQLRLDFDQVAKSSPVSAQFNAHLAGLYYDHSWPKNMGNRALRAPSSHMGYHGDAPGGVPFYEFTHGRVSWPYETVQ